MENEDRTWMYNRTYLNHVGLREEYKDGVAEFIAKAMTLDDFLTVGIIRYPYWKSNCGKLLSPDLVALHLYKNGFMLNYTVWIVHGECSSANDFSFQNYIESPIRENNVESSRYSEMVRDVFGTHSGAQNESNDEAKHFYEQLKEASHLLYEGSVHSKLSVAVRLLSIKSDYSIYQEGMNSIAKCAWNSCHENEIQDIFKLKAALRIKEYLYEARRKLQKSGWLKNDVWVKFFEIWDTPECKAKRERAKANRASEMGDSLHTRGFEKRIEDWRQIQSTSENGTMVQPSLADMTNMRTTMIGGPKKVRTYGCGVLQSSSSPSLFTNFSPTLQTMEEMEAMRKQIVELT
ncbi:hypothetical protein FXO37_10786 [Capsicum annuum]|nr:hypothetical protein FXO37_10786 [Capsicum annuum]